MKELIFSVEDIFNDTEQYGCLTQYESEFYHIPAYQRGYKWSTDRNGAVTILISDLWDAFNAVKKKEKSEYYLQYITVKKIELNKGGKTHNCLEVIDGQQRLTTLSILISVLSAMLDIDNLSAHKLDYAIRDSFFPSHIYKKEDLEDLVNLDWEALLDKESSYNKQDIYYLFNATLFSYEYFSDIDKNEVGEFYRFLLENVKLIVNSVETHIESETVFKNLNSNKIPLTEVELIKGLLLTKVGRSNNLGSNRNFKEIVEIRENLGRHWDEISRWANRPDIVSFYFGDGDGMKQLLMLAAMSISGKLNSKELSTSDKHLPLFNFYLQQPNFEVLFQKIKDIQATLNDWYNNDELYNLIGYCKFVKGSPYNNIRFLKTCIDNKKKGEVVAWLNKIKTNLLPAKDIENLRYGDEDNNHIHAVLLALSVFDQSNVTRFNFYAFIHNKWSLEHIFPQSPEGKGGILNDEQKEEIIKMLGSPISKDVKDVLSLPTRSQNQKELYYRALKNIGILDSIGNMCLLTSENNSSNGCGFFIEKRQNVLNFVRNGSFVPKHTFDVFSKMIQGLSGEKLTIWSTDDIGNHTKYIIDSLEKMK